jgi:hypothetical protein
MEWRDITRTPEPKVLRQFAVLCLGIGGGVAAWRVTRGAVDWRTSVFGALALIGVIGVAWPAGIRWVYSGWMIAVFPIGWTISRLVIALMFFALFTPVALVFRVFGRDALRRRRQRADSLWMSRRRPDRTAAYLRQY